MNADLKSASDDLAYLKGLVSGHSRQTMQGGQLFIAAGLLYALQCLGHWGQMLGWYPGKGLAALALGAVPTILFLGFLGWVMWTNRGAPKGNAATRAVNTSFAAIGSTNFVMIIVFGTVAAREHNFLIWLLYPCTVCALQGAAWLVSGSIYRRWWQMAVGFGWFAVTIGMALTIGTPTYLLLITIGLLVLMAGPGFIMVRQAAKEA